jgi:hypothetical protein
MANQSTGVHWVIIPYFLSLELWIYLKRISVGKCLDLNCEGTIRFLKEQN